MKRYVITHRARGWHQPEERFWGYKLSEYQRVADRLPQLTHEELERVWVAVAELLGKGVPDAIA
jgi:hypothetical protein